MNVKRFTARTSREAFALVRQEYGEDAVVLSTKPCAEGVEVLAMAPDSVAQLERVSAQASAESAQVDPRDTTGGRLAAAFREARPEGRVEARDPRDHRAPPAASRAPRESLAARIERDAPVSLGAQSEVDADVEQLAMSTLSFQDYVRDRMLRRRQAALGHDAETHTAAGLIPPRVPADPPEQRTDLRQQAPEPGQAARRALADQRYPSPRANARRHQRPAAGSGGPAGRESDPRSLPPLAGSAGVD